MKHIIEMKVSNPDLTIDEISDLFSNKFKNNEDWVLTGFKSSIKILSTTLEYEVEIKDGDTITNALDIVTSITDTAKKFEIVIDSLVLKTIQ